MGSIGNVLKEGEQLHGLGHHDHMIWPFHLQHLVRWVPLDHPQYEVLVDQLVVLGYDSNSSDRPVISLRQCYFHRQVLVAEQAFWSHQCVGQRPILPGRAKKVIFMKDKIRFDWFREFPRYLNRAALIGPRGQEHWAECDGSRRVVWPIVIDIAAVS